MPSLIRRRLELKIIISLMVIFACIVGIYTVVDIEMIRDDMVRASEQSLSALAATIKGSVDTAMRKGHHEEIGRLLEESRIPNVVDCIVIYDEDGAVVKQTGFTGQTKQAAGPPQVSPSILSAISRGDQSEILKKQGSYFLSYYSPIANRPECFRCHGKKAKLNGILRLDISLHGIGALIESHRNRSLVWTGVMSVALMAALVILLRTVVHKPVKELRDAMARAAKGNETRPFAVNGEDELADLKRSFVTMLERISVLHRTNLEREKALARSQEVIRFRAELQAMFDAMPDGVLLVDREFRIVQSNPRAYELLPWLREGGGRIPLGRRGASRSHHLRSHRQFGAALMLTELSFPALYQAKRSGRNVVAANRPERAEVRSLEPEVKS